MKSFFQMVTVLFFIFFTVLEASPAYSMLTDRYEAIPNEGQLAKPETLKSIRLALKYGFFSPFQLLPSAAQENKKDTQDTLDAINLELHVPGIESGQNLLIQIAKLIGYIFNPMILALCVFSYILLAKIIQLNKK